MGFYKINNISDENYIVIINKYGYNPIIKSINFNNKKNEIDDKKIILKKYTILENINKVDLYIDNKKYLLNKEKNSWKTKIKLRKGVYEYFYKINDSLTSYYDLLSNKYIEDGLLDYKNIIDVKEDKECNFSFNTDERFTSREPWLEREL